jgi:hypothetical protein
MVNARRLFVADGWLLFHSSEGRISFGVLPACGTVAQRVLQIVDLISQRVEFEGRPLDFRLEAPSS